MEKNKFNKSYFALVKEFEDKLGRKLTKEEQDFILWIITGKHKYLTPGSLPGPS